MSTKIYDFDTQLAFSHAAVGRVKRWLEAQTGIERAVDVSDVDDARCPGDLVAYYAGVSEPVFVEVKRDSRSARDTEYMAVERYSNERLFTPGGPFRGKTDLYAYVYADSVMLLVRTDYLINFMYAREFHFPVFRAQNKHYTTMGYLVKRCDLLLALGSGRAKEYKLD